MDGLSGSGTGHCAFQLWVGNVPFDASEAELKNVLSVAGRVLGVRVKYDAESGQSKGFGFVDFPDLESCLLLLQQQQQQPLELRGRKLKLDWATAELREAYGSGANVLAGNGGWQPRDMKWGRAATRQEARGGRTRLAGAAAAAVSSASAGGGGGAAAAAAASLMSYAPTDPFAAVPGALPSFVCEFMQCLSTSQLLLLLYHVQQLAQQHPHGCRRFLTDNPSLAYALLFGMYLVGATSSKELTAAEAEAQQHKQQQQQQQHAATFDALKRLPEFERKQMQRNRDQRQQQLKAAGMQVTRREGDVAASSTSTSSSSNSTATAAAPAPQQQQQQPQQQPQQKPPLLGLMPPAALTTSGVVSTDVTQAAAPAAAAAAGVPQAAALWPATTPVAAMVQAGTGVTTAPAKMARVAPEGPLLPHPVAAVAARPPTVQVPSAAPTLATASTPAAANVTAVSGASPSIAPVTPGARQWAAASKAAPVAMPVLQPSRPGAPAAASGPAPSLSGISANASRPSEATRDLPANRPQPNHPAWEVPPAAPALVDEVVKAPAMLNNVLNSTPSRMDSWTPEQRRQVLSLQSALLRRGYQVAM